MLEPHRISGLFHPNVELTCSHRGVSAPPVVEKPTARLTSVPESNPESRRSQTDGHFGVAGITKGLGLQFPEGTFHNDEDKVFFQEVLNKGGSFSESESEDEVQKEEDKKAPKQKEEDKKLLKVMAS